MKTVIGVGILGLPNVMKNLGCVLGMLMFAFTAFVNEYSCGILLKVKNLSHHSNFSTIGYYIFKSKWFQAYTYFLILFNNFGVCIIYLI
jgi:amino acid permease